MEIDLPTCSLQTVLPLFPHYTELGNFIKIILTLSHGNVALERGFSINKEVLIENMKEESITARKLVYDSVMNAGGVEKLQISKSLIHYAKNVRERYKEAQKSLQCEEEFSQNEAR
ncbi:hypothetical protein PR048_016076 [Dryococelus australis]|uniref:Uncharacterized protein n=1 Tax=Dryococelus australis TaxID=614101 RepID=A0ABQ9HIQ8_9NEOP|nr:hypothetical protein PR048_016076 [Dryococelus australis]